MTSRKIKEIRAILVHSSRPMWTKACIITIVISSSRGIEIPKDEKSILPGALVIHRFECGIECVLHCKITRLSQTRNTDQGNDTQGVMNPLSHTLVYWCYLNYHWSQVIGHSDSNSWAMVTIRVTRSILAVTTLHELTTILCLNLIPTIKDHLRLTQGDGRLVSVTSAPSYMHYGNLTREG